MAHMQQDSDYTCSLAEDVLTKARKELSEDPKTRMLEVKNLRKRVEKIPGLQPRLDARFLLGFLRARKFDIERSYKLLKSYYEARKDTDFFNDLKPSRIKHVIEDGVIEVLDGRDSNGCRVVVMRPGKWDPDRYPLMDLPKTVYLVLSLIIAQEEETQVHGIHLINNMSGLTWKHASNMTPSFGKRVIGLMQDAMPLRIKRYDILNEPTFFDVVFAIMKQFMKEKLVKRIHMNGDKFDKLHSSISKDVLPTDLGGNVPLLSNQKWKEEFLSSDTIFEEDFKFGFVDMTVKKEGKEDKSADAGMAGLGGTFRKLDI